jgi:hypothetical protein
LRSRRGAVAVVVLLLAGCGGGSKATPPTTTRSSGSKLTSADALRVAQMLFLNYQSGGAHVSASVDYSPQVSVQVAGIVDWPDHSGRLTVTSTFSNGQPQSVQPVVFTEKAVYDPATSAQASALAAKGHPGVKWLQRLPAPKTRPVDEIIGLIVSLSATRPDNPEIVARQGGLTFDHAEVVAGHQADAYASTKRSTYWVARRGGHLLRFRGLLPGFGGPIEVDLSQFGSTHVAVPAASSVAPASLLPPS